MNLAITCLHNKGFKQLPDGQRTCDTCSVTYTPSEASLQAYRFAACLLDASTMPDLREAFARFRDKPIWKRIRALLSPIGTLANARLVVPYQAWKLRRMIAGSIVDANAKCPACGHTDGEIRFSIGHAHIIHRCKICTAIWGENPIVKFADWKVDVNFENDATVKKG